MLSGYLRNTLKEAQIDCGHAQVSASYRLLDDDFILTHRLDRRPKIFDGPGDDGGGFTHVILNPSYKKINSLSAHRSALRKAGIETSNLYTGFMFLAARRLRSGGELVAIVPRLFCNGPYFKPFRERFFSMMSLRHIHVFEKRNHAFRDDAVLQENIIIHAVKDKRPSDITITTSHGAAFEIDPEHQASTAEDMTRRTVPHESVIRADDPDRFVHIAANELEQAIVDHMAHFKATLADIGVKVSTGPVADFRLKNDLQAQPGKGAVPLFYAAHFQGGALSWPKTMRKANAIRLSDESRKWLWANTGNFVVTRRFTSKEERRRILASVYASDLPGELVGFENHLNVFHADQAGMSRALAVGLGPYPACYSRPQAFRHME